MSNEKKLWKYDDLYTKITKIHPKDGDVIILHVKTDQDGNLINSVKDIQKFVDNVYEILERMGIQASVMALPDKICLNSVKNANEAIRELQNIIDYIREAMECIGDIKSQKKRKQKKDIEIDLDNLAKSMSFKGEEETQV